MALIDNVLLMGSSLSTQIRDALVSASLSGSLTQVTQLEMKLADPGWTILNSGLIKQAMTMNLHDFSLEISNIETGDDSGTETLTLKARPVVFRNLKNRRGPRVMKRVSPSQFVISECQAVHAASLVESSAVRPQVARDVPQKGDQETADNPSSSWTTFSRLADELGYIVFESCNQIYFGKPSFFVSRLPTVDVYYKTGTSDPNKLSLTTPTCSRSEDSPAIQIDNVELPTNSTSAIRPGYNLVLHNVPTFSGQYMVDSFSIDLADPIQRVSISAATPLNKKPSPPDKDPALGLLQHQGTLLVSDFVYWVQKSIGDKYVTGTIVDLTNPNPNQFDGSELAAWAAAQVGAFLPRLPNDQATYCSNQGTEISLSGGINTRGALLWRNGFIGISLGGNRTVESVRGRVGVISGNAQNRYTKAYKVPGLLY